jgi:adenosine deaminase
MSCGGTFSTDPALTGCTHELRETQDDPLTERSKLTPELLKALPKAHLHCHLDGCMRPATLIELASELNITHTAEGLELPTTAQTAEAIMRAPKECDSLVQYLKAFDVSLSVMQHANALRRIVVEVCEDAVADGVRYIELRFAPMLHTNAGLTLGEVMDAVLDGKAHAELTLPVVVGMIVCGIRHFDPAVVEQQASLAWRYRDRGVVGFDLAGPESGFSSLLHERAFDMVRKGRLNCTLHSAEAADWQSAHDSVLQCGAQRLGHGVRMDPMYGGPLAMVQWCADRQIAVEVCLTSNVQTKAITSFDHHPVSHFLDVGIPCAVSCDNVTVSDTTLSNEYVEFCKWYKLSPRQIIQLIDDSFKATFARPDIRRSMRRGALLDALHLMQKAGIDIQPAILAMRPFHADVLYRSVSESSSGGSGGGGGRSKPALLTAELLALLPKAGNQFLPSENNCSSILGK